MKSDPHTIQAKRRKACLLWLVAVLAVLFWKSFLPGFVHFNNDGPLGQQNSAWVQPPGMFLGGWNDLNSIGANVGGVSVAISSMFRWMAGPVGFLKFLAPFSLLLLGFCAWLFFRQSRLAPIAAILGALAATLNSTFFSAACWGVAAQEMGIGMIFLALACIAAIHPAASPWRRWSLVALAGFAVGENVMEGADIGALFSILLAAYVVYASWATPEGSRALGLARGVSRVIVIAGCAALISAYAIGNILGVQIKPTGAARQDEQSRLRKWDWATQWSMPKRETLGLIVPGLFGYRMDSPDGGNYWGGVGRDPAWDRYFESGESGPAPQGFMRFSGGGNYMGVIVLLVGAWAAFQSLLGKQSVFTPVERRLVWFWAAAVPITLLLAYGRFAPFYQWLYALPYFSTIRNPAKFLQLLSFAMVVLFAYGVHGLSRRYLQTSAARVKGWWSKAPAFDRYWLIGCVGLIVISLVGWKIYANSRPALEQYLQKVQLGGSFAPAIASFSIRQVGWFVLFLAAGTGMMAWIFSGALSGSRARWAGVFLGVLLVGDLARANLPWIMYVDYPRKYATNPVIDTLREKPYEHRVAILPFQMPEQYGIFANLYRIEWAQHQFPYYDIQSLDIIQMPRAPEDLIAFESALQFRGTPETAHLLTRRWALTNTRYLLGPTPYLDLLNEQIDPVQRQFQVALRFDLAPKPDVTDPRHTGLEDITAVPSSQGHFALFDFTGALPRAKLYTNWQTPADNAAAIAALKTSSLNPDEQSTLRQWGTNDYLTLKTLAAREFDPAKTVLLATSVPGSTNAPNAAETGTVEFTSYNSKKIVLQANAAAPSILLLNDKYDPNWQVRVDGKRAELLRCNFIMRGVQVPAGSHQLEFLFKPPVGPLYVNVAGVFLAVLLLGYVLVSEARNRQDAPIASANHTKDQPQKGINHKRTTD